MICGRIVYESGVDLKDTSANVLEVLAQLFDAGPIGREELPGVIHPLQKIEARQNSHNSAVQSVQVRRGTHARDAHHRPRR